MRIKICGLTTVEAVAAACDAGADALGFVFAPSPRRLSPAEAVELCTHLPNSITRVAVMHHPSLAELREVLEVFDPDCLQSDAEDFKEIEVRRGPHLLPVYRDGVSAPGLFPANRDQERARFMPDFVYEGPQSGQGETVDWARARQFAGRGRMVLAGGLNPDNVAAAIHQVQPWGVDVSSGVESQAGKKDPQLIAAFVAAVRAAEQELYEEIAT